MAEFEDACEALSPSVENLRESTTLKWIFVGGKGGVGKTTTACALSTLLAKSRESVLLLSTDPAHNVSDAWCEKFGPTPQLVTGFNNLYAMELDAGSWTSKTTSLINRNSLNDYVQELLQSFPGMDEALGFAELMETVQSMAYSVIVFDTAPTGHTLRLLGFPSLIEKGLGKLSELTNAVGSMVSALLSGGTGNGDDLKRKLSGLLSTAQQVQKVFRDPELTTFVCVCIPEFLSVFETERLIQELAKFGIDASNIIVNQVLFAEDFSNCHRCTARRNTQSKYLSQIQTLYEYDFHVSYVPQLVDEVRGPKALQNYADLLMRPNIP